MERLFAKAGHKAVTSLAAALDVVFDQLSKSTSGLDAYHYADRTLRAGRPGSWESVLLTGVVAFGCRLNLNQTASMSSDAAAMRTIPSRRVNQEARDQMAAVLTRWVTNPTRYTEVAENLADIVSGYADQHGADGWRRIADQWLQPTSALVSSGFSTCYRLFYSRSEHRNPDWT